MNHRTEIIDLFYKKQQWLSLLYQNWAPSLLFALSSSAEGFFCGAGVGSACTEPRDTLGSSVCIWPSLVDWKSAQCRCKMNRNTSQKQENKLNIWEKQILTFVIPGSVKSVSSCVPLRLQTVNEGRGGDSNYQQERSHQASQNPLHQKSWIYCHLLWTAYILLCLQRLCMVRKKI